MHRILKIHREDAVATESIAAFEIGTAFGPSRVDIQVWTEDEWRALAPHRKPKMAVRFDNGVRALVTPPRS